MREEWSKKVIYRRGDWKGAWCRFVGEGYSKYTILNKF